MEARSLMRYKAPETKRRNSKPLTIAMCSRTKMRRTNAFAWSVLLVVAIRLPLMGQPKDGDSPILEAREISGGCCQRSSDTTFLRVFSNGHVEWDEVDDPNKPYVRHQGMLSKKQMRAIQRAIDNMKGLRDFYKGKSAEGNIDSEYTFAITARKNDKTHQTEILFGLPVDSDNYSKLPRAVRSVACNVTVTRDQLTHEKMDDPEFCKRYYAGS
jgi:hypothetical protein